MREITVDKNFADIDDIISAAKNQVKVKISEDNSFIKTIESSRELLHKAMENEIPVYGVTTGYGKSCGKRMAMDVAIKNGNNLIRFHGCGTGQPLAVEEVRAAVFSRILCFARGYSGVSIELMNAMADFLNHGITPVIPEEGSVGASGDLTPMSYVAAALAGDREVFYKGERMPSADAIKKAGLKPYVFKPKEPLAIMNGTAAMCGIGVMAISRAEKILNAAICSTALAIHALKGNDHHYYAPISEAKPHPGQKYISEKILSLLETIKVPDDLVANELETLQDPYSIRCAPQILGVLSDSLVWIREWIKIESNSANDNPIFDTASGEVLMGGNFYGGHVAFAMDALKAAVASAVDMMDRQIQLLCNPNVNRGLPADLVSLTGDEKVYNHGFKAISIASSSLAAEALKLTFPAASFSRSTESHNQDKVSMGSHSARDARKICELAEKTASMHLLAAAQACEIRGNISVRKNIQKLVNDVRSISEPVREDRPLDADIEKLAVAVRESEIFNF